MGAGNTPKAKGSHGKSFRDIAGNYNTPTFRLK